MNLVEVEGNLLAIRKKSVSVGRRGGREEGGRREGGKGVRKKGGRRDGTAYRQPF